jgi:hypothetical protein
MMHRHPRYITPSDWDATTFPMRGKMVGANAGLLLIGIFVIVAAVERLSALLRQKLAS